MKTAKSILIENDIRPSYHRVRIMCYLMKNKIHPTAESIYRELLEETQTISKVTVYNTLNLFRKKGLVNTLDISGEETRFDITTTPHPHFLCTECGEVTDYKEMDAPLDKIIGESPYIKDVQLVLRGVCEKCRNPMDEKKLSVQDKEEARLYYFKVH